MRILVALALASSGCHLVFGSGPAPLLDDAAGDAASSDATDAASDDAAPDARPDASGCVGTEHVATILNDTYIIPDVWPNVDEECSPAARYGKANSLNLGAPVSNTPSISRVLLRFQVPISLLTSLAANETLGSATLRLQPVMPCPSCMPATTTVTVHGLTDSWVEGEGGSYSGAGWCMKNGLSEDNQIRWGLPGADGPAERSDALAALTVSNPVVSSPIELPIPAATAPELATWISGNHLSLILIASSGGPLYLYSREGAIASPLAAPALTLTTCAP